MNPFHCDVIIEGILLMPVTKLCRNNTMFIKKTRLGVRVRVRVR